jgi:hypothetical protein
VVVAATASAKAALLKDRPRPKLNYKPHTGPLRPFFSPKPFLMPHHQQQHQQQHQRKPLGAKSNVNGVVVGGATPVSGGSKLNPGPVVAKPPAIATKQL